MALVEINGKVALVTGANRGIGQAIAVALAHSGADIAVNFHTHRDEADAVCGEIVAAGRRCAAFKADVASASDVTRLAGEVEQTLGAIEILVNNAGIVRPQPLESITERDWDELIDVNLKSAFVLTQAVLPRMRAAHWGRVINVSSVAAQTGGVVGPHYAASKAGMLGLTHYYAALLAKEGITVNAIAPALIETAMVKGNRNARPTLIPVGRFGATDEVAAVAVLLARDGYITGQTINVNGGWYMV